MKAARSLLQLIAFLGALVVPPPSLARAAQLLPTARDGDIRTVIWELQNRLEVFLTRELRTPDRKMAPVLTLSAYVRGPVRAGLTKNASEVWPKTIELRAHAGALWAPRAQFWLELDDDEIVLVREGWAGGLVTGPATDYLPLTISGAMLNQIAEAERVRGNALGFDFELSGSQRLAIRAFRDRIARM